jgi:iron complex transport system substrate-binding protein
LKPDLVVGLPTHQILVDKLKKLLPETEIITVKNEPVSEVIQSIGTIGEKTGKTKEAAALQKSLQDSIQRHRKAAKGKEKPRVLIIVSHAPDALQQVYSAGPTTYLNELLTIVGGTNVITAKTPQYPIISQETIVGQNPEIIIDTALSDIATTDAIANTMEIWKTLPRVDAVKSGKVYIINKPFLTIPGPESIIKSLDYLSLLIHK